MECSLDMFPLLARSLAMYARYVCIIMALQNYVPGTVNHPLRASPTFCIWFSLACFPG